MRRFCTVSQPRPTALPLIIGEGRPLAVIAGPCVLESRELALTIAQSVRDACEAHGLPFIFKASFDKANRTSVSSGRGPGFEKGLADLAFVREKAGVPVTTDIHLPEQAEGAARVVDVLQIPAFLCRQTDLLLASGEAAAKHGRAVNVKKGQFLSPREMIGPVKKLESAGCTNVLLTERGTFFGYHRLVNDFIGVADMAEILKNSSHGSPPVCFDCTHSTQLPGAGETSGGRPERAPMLARAAVAAGVHALFLECHPDPANAASDAATTLALADIPTLLAQLRRIHDAMKSG